MHVDLQTVEVSDEEQLGVEVAVAERWAQILVVFVADRVEMRK